MPSRSYERLYTMAAPRFIVNSAGRIVNDNRFTVQRSSLHALREGFARLITARLLDAVLENMDSATVSGSSASAGVILASLKPASVGEYRSLGSLQLARFSNQPCHSLSQDRRTACLGSISKIPRT